MKNDKKRMRKISGQKKEFSLFFFLILYNLSLTYYGIHKSLRHKITFAFFQSDVYKTCHSILIRFADIYLIRIFAIQTAAGITAHCPATLRQCGQIIKRLSHRWPIQQHPGNISRKKQQIQTWES